jgi:hypothetical protein
MEWNLELGGAEAAAIALAILFGALLLIIYFCNRLPRRSTSQVPNAETAEMHAAMVRLYGELPDLFHNMSCRLDAKMQVLRNLIREAGASIEALRAASSRVAGSIESSERMSANVLNGATATPEATAVRNSPAAGAAAGPAEPADSPLVEFAQPDTAELRLQRYAHVYSLADNGLDSTGIAGETGMHRGEVELVLNLRRKRVRVDRGSRSEPSPVVRSPEEAPA